MTEIDNATGLPELPDGYFWSLGKYNVTIRKKLPDTEWKKYSSTGLLYDIGKSIGERSNKETKVKTEEVETRVRVKHWWWPREKYKTVTKMGEVTYDRYVNRSILVVDIPTAYTGETDTIYGTSHYTGTRYPYGYYYGSGVSTYERTPDKIVKLREVLTRDNVMPLCLQALKELDGLSLQGDYPPKKFEHD